MQNSPEQNNCSIHNQACVAVNIAEQVDPDNLLLCIKCMADKLSLNNNVILVEEAVTIFKQMKSKEHETKKSVIEKSIQRYQTSITKISDYMEWQNGCLNKILIQFKSEIESLQSQLNLIIENKLDDKVESNLQVLGQIFHKQNINNQTNISFINQEQTREFFILIEKQLQSLRQQDKMQQIFDHFNEVINEKPEDQESIIQKIENCFNSKKTPFLQHECSKHGKEIIVFTLDENYQGERVLCVDCFPRFQHEVITLENANKLWMTHQGELYDNQNKFLSEREQKQYQLCQIIQQNEGKQKKILNEIKQLIETQNEDIGNQIRDLQQKNNKQSLMQLELKDLKITINQLSQKNKFIQLQQQQQNQIEEDQVLQKEILKKQFEIQSLQEDCKKKVLELFGSTNDQQIKEYQISIERFQNEIENQQLDSGIFINLIPKFQDGLLQSQLVLMQGISEKGHKYIEQLNNADFKIKNKEQEQMNINRYQDILNQFDWQYQVIKNQINQRDASTLIEDNQQINSQIINITQQLAVKNSQLSINSINKMQIESKINALGLQDQLIQTNNNLNINKQIIAVSIKLLKQKAFSINRQLYTNWSNRPYNAKLLKFSTIFKHKDITISADGKTAKSTIGNWYLCLCDQPIPKYDTFVVDFKVKQLQDFMAGVCLIDQIKKDYQSSHRIGNG